MVGEALRSYLLFKIFNQGSSLLRAKRPLSKVEIMQREMEMAIAKELYERAAELRDAIKQLKAQAR